MKAGHPNASLWKHRNNVFHQMAAKYKLMGIKHRLQPKINSIWIKGCVRLGTADLNTIFSSTQLTFQNHKSERFPVKHGELKQCLNLFSLLNLTNYREGNEPME